MEQNIKIKHKPRDIYGNIFEIAENGQEARKNTGLKERLKNAID